MKKIVTSIIALALLVMVGWTIYDFVGDSGEDDVQSKLEDDEGIELGMMAPNFTLETLEGERVQLSDFRGQPVIINFWATWCPPCQAEIPDLEKFYEAHDDVVILAVNATMTERSEQTVIDFVEDYGMTFPVLKDEKRNVGLTYKVAAFPTSYIVRPSGHIQSKMTGPMNYDLMENELKKMN